MSTELHPLTPAPTWDATSRPRPERAAWPLGVAAVAGIAAYVLTISTDGQSGLNVAIWVAIWVGLLLWSTRRRSQTPTREGLTLLGVALAFALTFALWDAPGEFQFLNALALVLALVLGAAVWRHAGLATTATGRMTGMIFTGGSRLFYGPFALLERFPWGKLRGAKAGRATPWLTGLLLTVPVLLVFGGLLAGADSGFADLISGLWRWNPENLIQSSFTVLLWVAFAGGLAYPALMALSPTLLGTATDTPEERGGRLGLIETGMPLLALGALFLVFLFTQLPYFLSGITLPDGFTFAEYVRRGFSELLWVAFLTLGLLLAAYGLTRPNVRAQATYRLLNLAVLLPLALVLVSAANRWRLYTLAYGLSEIRVLGAALLVWLVLALAWLGVCLWRGTLRRFAYPALLAGFGTLLLATLINPGALIARVNVGRELAAVTNVTRSTPQQADLWSLIQLGADAVPTVVANLDTLTRDCPPGECGYMDHREYVILKLKEEFGAARDPRVWNLSQERARRAVLGLRE
ncbi:DUF4153 domain-containing protein [Deinococcus sp. QL22]|uniref:DUF4153 domain-containing protein n=1 Tax=Deinococcus sp. QL22 TaxID=2939437 RepID=UPI002016DD48|nr:DUF4173 domain-containing protein [Deinococcus sp. QL22]UQN04964.1 DUF4173 domain-containing protein [Deinococcus sp. QL22]